MTRRSLVSLALVALALPALGCRTRTPAPPAAPAAPAPDTGALPSDGLTEEEARRLLPGIDTSMLTPAQRQALTDLANETFCPCSAMTVAGCVRAGAQTCPAAVREVELAKRLLAAGDTPASVLLRVESYYGTFPRDRRRDVAATGPSKGAADARVVIVEFSDFQCPACRSVHKQLDELVKKYPKDVRVVFRHFPLPQHERAAAVAAASIHAAAQDRFWPFADLVFANQDALDDANLREYARQAGLDPDAVVKASTDPQNRAKVEADREAGTALQLNATPSLFINGRPYVLRPSLEYLSWTVEDELEWLSHGGAWSTKQ